MDTRDLAKVLLKIAGLVIFATAIFDIPYYLPPYSRLEPGESVVSALLWAAAMLLLPIVIGLAFWFFPGKVVNRIVSGDRIAEAGVTVAQIERAALTVVGIWLAASGLTDLVYKIVSVIAISRQHPGSLSLEVWSPVIAGGAKLIVGLCLAVGARGVQRTIAKVRGQE